MSDLMEKANVMENLIEKGCSDPWEPAGGTMVPGSPRSGPSAESCAEPNPVEGLPTGYPSRNATAEDSDNQLVRSIVNRYLGLGVPKAPQRVGANLDSDDCMSVTGLSSATPRKKRIRKRESLSDTDVDGLPAKGRKVLRSRIIGTDSEEDNMEGAIILSDSPKDVAVKVRGRKARKQKLDKLEKLDDSFESTRVIFTDCPSHLAHEDLQNKDVDEIAVIFEGWLNDMEMARFCSKKINGKFSSVLKDRIVCLRSIIKALAERVKNTGDVSYLRRRNDELASQLRESRKEESRLQAFLKEADSKVEKLSSEITELKKKISSNRGLPMDGTSEVEKTPPPPVRGRSDTSKMRISTIKKETPKKRDNVRAVSMAESL